jgi:hypothetical protein
MMNVEQWTSYVAVKENETYPREIIASSKFQTMPRKSPEIEMPRNSHRSRGAPDTKNSLLNTIVNYVALVGQGFSFRIQVTIGRSRMPARENLMDLADLVGESRSGGFGGSHGVNTHTRQSTFDDKGTRR